MKYILVNGYTATGSSAVVDLLQEFNHMYVPPHEFRLLCDPFGIIDLDREINNSVDCLNDDISIRSFQWLTKKYFKTAKRFGTIGLNYEKDFTKNIRVVTDEYINIEPGKVVKYNGSEDFYVKAYDTEQDFYEQYYARTFEIAGV